MKAELGDEPISLTAFSPRARHALRRLGVRTIGALSRLTPESLTERQSWMSPDELRDRRFAALLTYREIRDHLAGLGLSGYGLAGQPIAVLGLSLRATIQAERRGVSTVGQLCDLTAEEILEWSGFGETTLKDIEQALGRVGCRLSG